MAQPPLSVSLLDGLARPLAAASEGLDEASLQLLVENAVFRDDVAPLLRILFSFTSASASKAQDNADVAGSSTASGDAGPSPVGLGQAGAPATTVESAVSDGKQALSVISKSLEKVAAEQDQVIRDICNAHAHEIVGFVSDMHSMQQGVTQVQKLMTRSNEVLQVSGRQLMSSTQALSELAAVQDNVVGGLAGVRGAKQLLSSCLQVGQLLEDRQLYQALRMIEDMQSNQLAALLGLLAMPPTQGSGTNAMALGGPAAAPGTGEPGSAAAAAAAAGRQLANVLSLQAFFESLVLEFVAAVEVLATSEVHTWLVAARSNARTIGLRAVRRAAIQRQLEEDLARERLRLAAQLTMANEPLLTLCQAVVASPHRTELEADTTWPPPAQPAAPKHATITVSSGSSAAPLPATTLPAANGHSVISMASAVPPAEVAKLHPGQPQAAVADLIERWTRQHRRKQQQQNRAKAAAAAAAAAAAKGVTSGVAGAAAAGGAIPPPGYLQGPGTLMDLGSQLCKLTDTTVPLLAGLPMRGLLRCMHIHKVLGRTQRLREHYVEQRRLQVAADLAAPHVPFLENYQAYLGQVVGFFVIEAWVNRLMPELLPQSTAQLLWEGASAQLKGVLERVLCSPGAPGLLAVPSGGRAKVGAAGSGSAPGAGMAPIMVTVKDFVMLASDALEEVDCSPAALEDVLLAAAQRYHELLLADAAQQVQRILASDPLTQEVRVKDPEQARQLCITLGLPACLDNNSSSSNASNGKAGAVAANGNGMQAALVPAGEALGAGPLPVTPFAAPFTPLVPALLRLVRGFVQDSAAYLRGLLPAWEMEEALTQARDRLVQRVLVEALLGRAATLQAHGTQVAESMWLVTDAWALVRAAPALDAHLAQVAAPPAEQDADVQRWLARAAARGGGGGARRLGEQGAGGGGVLGSRRTGTEDAAAAAVQRSKRARGSEVGSNLGPTAPPPSLPVLLHMVQDGAERAVLRQVGTRVDSMLREGFKAMPWMPLAPLPPGPSDHVLPLIAYLQECFEAARHALPRASWAFLTRTTLKSIALSYMKLFSPDGIKGFNFLVVERLALDISALQNFAARAGMQQAAGGAGRGGAVTHTTGREAHEVLLGASNLHPLLGLPQQFAEPEQLFSLLLSAELEGVLVPELRRQRYPNLEPAAIVLALDKYRELPKIGKDKTTFPTRKQVDAITKALRSQLVVGTASAVLQGF